MMNLDIIGVSGEVEAMGALVSWDTRDTTHAAFAQLCRDAGVAAPPEPSDEICVRRALDAVVADVTERTGKAKRGTRDDVTRYLVRPLRQRGAYALVAERVSGKRITGHEMVIERASVEKGLLKLEVPWTPPSGWPHTADGTRDRVRRAYETVHAEYPKIDVGAHFCAIVKSHKGLAYREAGGVYFVDGRGLTAFRAIKRVSTSQRISLMPVLRCDEVVDAVLGALERTVDTQIAQSYARLREGVGERGRDTERGTLADLKAKLAHYEGLLGKRLDGLRGKIEATDTALTAGQLCDLFEGVA